MSAHVHHHKPFPKGVLWAAFAMVIFSIGIAGLGRMTDFGTLRNPEAMPRVSHELNFADRSDGAVVIRLAATGEQVIELAPGTNGFARSVLRGLARERKLESLGQATPFVLTSWSDGRMTLEDPATGREVELNAFGQTQIDTFAGIMAAAAGVAGPQAGSQAGSSQAGAGVADTQEAKQ
jgi:putative photosynthetic complex assembly protein